MTAPRSEAEAGPEARIAPPRRRPDGVVALIVVLFLALALPLAVRLNLWKDEAFSIYTTSGTLAEAFWRAVHFELQPPLYFALLRLWRGLSDSLPFARLLSVLAVAAALPVVAALSRRVLPRLHPGWVTAAVAFNPFVVWAALEVRVYPLALALQAVLLLAAFEAFLAESRPRWALPAVVATSAALLYTQYYSGFLLPALGVGLAAAGRRRELPRYFGAMAGVGLLFAPMLVWLPGQVTGHVGSANVPLPPLAAFRAIALRAEEFVLPALPLLEGEPGLAWSARVGVHWLLRLVALGLVVVAVRRAGGPGAWLRHPGHRWLLAILATVAVQFVVLLAVLQPELARARHTVALFLPVVLVVFALVGGSRRTAAAWTVLTLGVGGLVLVRTYRPMAKGEDSARVAEYLMAHERPGQPILVFASDGVVPLGLYYHGPNRLVGIPRPFPLVGYDVRTLAVGDTAELAARVDGAGSREGEYWLVLKPTHRFMGVDYRYDVLQRWLDTRFRVAGEARFHDGVLVRRLISRARE